MIGSRYLFACLNPDQVSQGIELLNDAFEMVEPFALGRVGFRVDWLRVCGTSGGGFVRSSQKWAGVDGLCASAEQSFHAIGEAFDKKGAWVMAGTVGWSFLTAL